jgi:hypothetical protein
VAFQPAEELLAGFGTDVVRAAPSLSSSAEALAP